MLINSFLLPSQALAPLGIAVVYGVLCFYIIWRCRLDNAMSRLGAAYFLLSGLWQLTLMAAAMQAPYLAWAKITVWGLVILGVVYWAFSRAFLQRGGSAWWGWAIGALGLAAVVTLDMNLLVVPSNLLAWSQGWLTPDNVTFVFGLVWAGLFLLLAVITAQIDYFRAKLPAHKNRIQFLLIAIAVLAVGYGLYLSLREPLWTTGLIVTCLGGLLTAYIAIVENLVDLGTGARYTMRTLVVALITVLVYIAGIYLVNIFLGDLLAATFLSRFFDRTLLAAAVAAVLLTIVHMPIRRLSLWLTDRLLFGQQYDYEEVIHHYTQAVSNILYIHELAGVVLSHIQETLGVDNALLFMLDAETPQEFNLRSVPPTNSNDIPRKISLAKNTPITNRLIADRQALSQYSLDISGQFKNASLDERQALKALNAEHFIPILKQEQLIGMLALGLKKSGRPYSGQDMRLLRTLADQTALALENAALFDRLQRNLDQTTRMKNLMNNVFDSIDNGVMTTDIMGKITLFNRAAESILATPSEQCVGFPYLNALPTLANTIMAKLIENVARREAHYADYEITSTLPNRGQVNLKINLSPLKDTQNQTQGVTIVMDDLTETKRLRAVQDMFRCYVSPAVVDRLPSDPADLKLGGHRQMITVLFADIRGFTSFSEKLGPEELVEVLNQYLSMAAASILMYEGTLDKFMGDAVMGIFNAPLEQPDHTLRAVRAAAAMQRAIRDYHHSIGQERGLNFGVGVHVGDAVVGNVGMPDRMDYTAIGDTVNLAKRIQENTPGGKVLISDAVYEVVKDSVNAEFYQELKVKGREQPVNAYELRST